MGAVDAFHMKTAAFEAMTTQAWAKYASAFASSLRGGGRIPMP